jgi:hypothetical protein
MKILRFISLFALGGSIAGAVFLIFDVTFIDHQSSYDKAITFALISIASSGVWFIMHTEEKSK